MWWFHSRFHFNVVCVQLGMLSSTACINRRPWAAPSHRHGHLPGIHHGCPVKPRGAGLRAHYMPWVSEELLHPGLLRTYFSCMKAWFSLPLCASNMALMQLRTAAAPRSCNVMPSSTAPNDCLSLVATECYAELRGRTPEPG